MWDGLHLSSVRMLMSWRAGWPFRTASSGEYGDDGNHIRQFTILQERNSSSVLENRYCPGDLPEMPIRSNPNGSLQTDF